MKITPIGHIRSCYGEKFAIPRQPGLSEHAWGTLSFEAAFRSPEAVRGLADFSHLWLIFGFHQTASRGWSPTVRPPRLGGNQRVGVFATRSTHRPNALGLSLVKLERMELVAPSGPILHLTGLDLLDGTPIYDIKPYLHFADSALDATSGFASHDLTPLKIVISPEASSEFESLPVRSQQVICESLRHDPRPSTQRHDQDRVFGALLCGHNVRFRVTEMICQVLAITPDERGGLAD